MLLIHIELPRSYLRSYDVPHRTFANINSLTQFAKKITRLNLEVTLKKNAFAYAFKLNI